LAITNFGGNDVSVLLGSGTGTFAPAVNYAAESGPRSVTSADFNGDGKADLAIAKANSGNISVLLGSSTGTFAPKVNYAVGSNPFSVTSADFNGDGKADLATAGYSNGNVSVLLGSGTGTFATAVNYSVGSNPFSLTSADFNGNGNADLAIANYGGNNVSVLLNTSPLPAKALSFDGINDKVAMSASVTLTNLAPAGFSMESWVYPRSSSGVHSIIRKTGDYNLFINGGKLVAEVWTSGTSTSVFKAFTAAPSLSLNTWSHVAFT
jgi:hypothetical protein